MANLNGQKIVENIFFLVTCISVFTCIIRSDYNFAMGLLSYYMIKNMDAKNKMGSEIAKIARTVSCPLLSIPTCAVLGVQFDRFLTALISFRCSS